MWTVRKIFESLTEEEKDYPLYFEFSANFVESWPYTQKMKVQCCEVVSKNKTIVLGY